MGANLGGAGVALHCVGGGRYNCVNHFENQKTFNDGYHVIHHIKPGLHWTMLPQEFENT